MKYKKKSKKPKKHQRTCPNTEPSPNLIINRLPDEVLLEVFDYYRQSFGDQYNNQWRKKYAWFNLAHVCRRWRAVMFASYSRLDLNIVVGPKKPGHIKAILSVHLPILIDYSAPWSGLAREITASTLWRMRAALRHRDRVREISFGGWGVAFIGKFISATNYHFPALESLVLNIQAGQEPDIPATFLKGPDQSDVPLRRLKLYGGSLTSVSGLLLSATALTDLTLDVPSNPASSPVESSHESILLVCLQGMQCLYSLDLTTPYSSSGPIPKDIVPLLKLTNLRYSGPTIFLNYLMSGLSVPSLQDARFDFRTKSPFLCLSRIIDDLREEFRSVWVNFAWGRFCLLSSTHSGEIDHSKSSFRINMNNFPLSAVPIYNTPSTKLALAEELALCFPNSRESVWGNVFSMRGFLRQFRSVRVLRVSPFSFVRQVGLHPGLQQDEEEAILPLLEEIELSDEEFRRREAEAVADLEPFLRARTSGSPCASSPLLSSRKRNWELRDAGDVSMNVLIVT